MRRRSYRDHSALAAAGLKAYDADGEEQRATGLTAKPFSKTMQIEALLQHFLMYLVVPVWLLAGLGDWVCHRLARIETTSGVAESLMHAVQFALVGLPLLAVLFLEVNAAVLLAMLVGLALHQAVAIWDVRYANDTRRVTPAEQHVHGILEMAPAFATAIVVILHWPQFRSLLSGANEARFSLEPKHVSLPGWYLAAVLVGVVLCGVLPYGEELVRTAWAASAARSRQRKNGPPKRAVPMI